MASTDTDAACGTTRIKCALQGVQVLLQSLSPCTPSSTSTKLHSFRPGEPVHVSQCAG
jgi:hypothetical protein